MTSNRLRELRGPRSSTSPLSWTRNPPLRIRKRRPSSGPESRAALESVSASSAVSPSAVAPISPVHAGSPVEGSSRWCANRPSGVPPQPDVQARCGDAPGGQLDDVGPLPGQGILDLDIERPGPDREATHADVPAAVDHEAPVAAQAPGQQVRRQALAGAPRVEGDTGRAMDHPLAIVDVDLPPQPGSTAAGPARAEAPWSGHP